MRALPLALIFACASLAADWSSLYGGESIESQRARLTKDLALVVEQEIQPYLTTAQAHAFSKLKIESPALVEPGANPLDFFSVEENRMVVPLLTIAFVEDMGTAYSWLWANRCSSRTVDEYFGMLRNRQPSDFSGGRYPVPLEALHIPADALKDPIVARMSSRVRATTLAFIVLHEFGHLSYRTAADESALKHDPVYGEEELADAFALDIMKRNSETPVGLLMLMHGMLYLPAAEGKAHPVSGRRLHAMADYLDGHVQEFAEGRPDRRIATLAMYALALHLRQSAKFVADAEGQRIWAEQGAKTTVGDLVPRHLEAEP